MKRIFILFAFFSLNAYSQCYDEDYKKLANILSYNLVNIAWSGGNNITTKVINCSYDSDIGVFKTDVIIEFYGQLSGSYYRADGQLKYNKYTEKFYFDATYKNQNLLDYEAFIGIIQAGYIAYELSK